MAHRRPRRTTGTTAPPRQGAAAEAGCRDARAGRPVGRWARLAPMTDALAALDSSVRRLADLVRPLDDDALARPAYPSEWSIADVLSHIGSGAVIFGRLLADGLAGTPTPDDFNPSVWDRW